MSVLSDFIKERTPKFNKKMVEGLCYHQLNKTPQYLDDFIRYSTSGKTRTHLTYLGYRTLTPREEYRLTVDGKKTKYICDMALSDLYAVEFRFSYTGVAEEKKVFMYLPFLSKGNVINISGSKFLISPVLADKVVSVGDNVVFVNIRTAKYNFRRIFHVANVNGVMLPFPVIVTELYRNQSKRMENTTKASPTLLHYMLGVYGYSKTMQLLLGFVPAIMYGQPAHDSNKVVMKSSGSIPRGYIRDKSQYRPTNIHVVLEKEQNSEHAQYIVGNLFYLLDNFPESITLSNIDDPTIWKKLLGEIIHSGNHQISYIMEKMDTHFKDLLSDLDSITVNKVRDIGHVVGNMIDLIGVILCNYNTWIMSSEAKSLYYTKAYEVEIYALNKIISNITKCVLDISKEELRIGGAPIEPKDFNKIIDRYLKRKSIYALRNDKLIASSIEYAGDHLYPKHTSVIVEQEANPININKEPDASVAEKKRLSASMITVGSILGLTKKNPTPIVRMNPYVTTDPVTNTVLPHPVYGDLIERTGHMLDNLIGPDQCLDPSLLLDGDGSDDSVENDDSDYSSTEEDDDVEEVDNDD
jgi:hypothetical protein